MARARVVTAFLAVLCCSAVHGAVAQRRDAATVPSFRSVLAWSNADVSAEYDLRDTSDKGLAELVSSLMRVDGAGSGSLVVVAVAEGGNDQRPYPPSAATWRSALPSTLHAEAATVAVPYLEARALGSADAVAAVLKEALPHVPLGTSTQGTHTSTDGAGVVVLQLAELGDFLKGRSDRVDTAVVVLSAPFLDTAATRGRDLAEVSPAAAGATIPTTIAYVRMTPDIATGLLVTALLVTVLIIGVNCLLSIGSPSRFVHAPLPPGKDF